MVTWKKGEFRDEKEEFERITREFVGNDPQAVQDNLRYLDGLYYTSFPENLNNRTWKELGNTGSFGTKSFDRVFKNLRMDGVRRDISRIVTQFIGEGRVNDFSGSVHCPIIIHTPENEGVKYHLVAGNTRLSIASVLGIKPQVVILRTDW